MSDLHALFETIILDPTDSRHHERVDALCYLIWEECLARGWQPWGWCFDRYCSCKVALSEHEPDPLPIDATAATRTGELVALDRRTQRWAAILDVSSR